MPPRGAVIHPRWVRVTHWINALAMLMMIGSGWQIYDASPLFGFEFPAPDCARQLACRRAAVAFRRHVAVGDQRHRLCHARHFASGRFRRKLFPIHPGDVVRDLFAALRGRLSHDDLSVYNAVQKLLYLGILLIGVVIVLSGLSIWKPVQFHAFDELLRRLQHRALRPLRRHDGDCRRFWSCM